MVSWKKPTIEHKKITVTTGTRAEYGILRSLLKEIKRSKELIEKRLL